MLTFGKLTLLTLVLATSSVAFADEVVSPVNDQAASPTARLLAETMLAELDYSARARLFHPAEATPFANESVRPIADIDFEDHSGLARFRNLRGLSLLTVAEVGDTRLYLGINDDGLVGLHFGAFLRATGTRHLELLRMPYLAHEKPAP